MLKKWLVVGLCAGAAMAQGQIVQREEPTVELLHQKLGITAPQQDAWVNYQRCVEAYVDVFLHEKPVLASDQASALQSIARMVDRQQNRLAALEEVEAAAKRLYASLDASQQKTADQWLPASIPKLGADVDAGGAGGPRGPRARAGKPEGAHSRHGPGAGPGP